MNVHFTEEQKMLQKAIRDFVAANVADKAAEWDAEDHCPVEMFPALGELGVLGIFVPEQYGGLGLGHVERVMALEEIARWSAGLAMFVFTHHLGMGAILDFASEEQKMKYLPDMCAGKKICGLAVTEPGGGSDLNGQKVSAELVDGQWVVNGRKCFITNSHVADVTVFTAKTGVDEKGRNQFSALIVEKGTPGFAPGREENKLGLKGSCTGELIFTDCKIPEENVCGAVGKGSPIALKEIGEIGRASMTAITVGIMRGCMECGVEFANERIIYGKPLSKIQAIQFKLAECRVDYEATRMFLYRAACLKDEGVPTTLYNGMGKLFGTNAAVRVAQGIIEVMGAYGCINEYPVGRFYREAVVCISSGGTNEVQKMIIAGDTLKLDWKNY